MLNFSCRSKNNFLNKYCASTAYTKSEKARWQKLPQSERGRYAKKNLRTCFHLNNRGCANFFSLKKIRYNC